MERLRLSSFVLAYEAEEKYYDAPEQPGRRRVSSALAGEAEKEEAGGFSGAPTQAECRHAPKREEAGGCSGAPAQVEKEAECRHASEKEAECPDPSPEEAEEEAECPDSPEEEEEEAEASSLEA